MQLGKKVRDLRFRRGLTVQQLAEASGLSKGFISQVENDRTSPSLATLRDLARALKTSISSLVVEEDSTPHVVRESQRPRIQFGNGSGSVEILSAQPKRGLEVLIAELPPSAVTGTERPDQQGETCILCLSGTIRVTLGENIVTLSNGDACHYDGRTVHSVENCGSGAARVLLAVTPASTEPTLRIQEPAEPVEVEQLT